MSKADLYPVLIEDIPEEGYLESLGDGVGRYEGYLCLCPLDEASCLSELTADVVEVFILGLSLEDECHIRLM